MDAFVAFVEVVFALAFVGAFAAAVAVEMNFGSVPAFDLQAAPVVVLLGCYIKTD